MPILTLESALSEVRSLILDDDTFVSAIAAGKRRGAQPELRRAEIRRVEIRGVPHTQVVRHGVELRTDNFPPSREGRGELSVLLDDLLAQPFGNWHVESARVTYQLRVTKKGKAQVSHGAGVTPPENQQHDRVKQHLLGPDDPIFTVLGADADKRRQVDAFLRSLRASMEPALQRARAEDRPLRVVDLGCGNAYLTFGVHRWLSQELGADCVRTVGVELRPELVERSANRAREAGLVGLDFVAGAIENADPFAGESPDIALALHACDTATDAALARAIQWRAPVILAAPCCHRDIQKQLGVDTAPAPYEAIVRHPILRQRFADVLTDTLRSLLLRERGYRVDVVEFVDSRHTPRNAMIRASRTGAASSTASAELRELTAQWQLRPALERMLAASPRS